MNPVPVILSVSELLPAGKVGGVTPPLPECGSLIVNVNETEVLPSGFVTITYGFPAVATAPAGMIAASWVELTKVVGTLFRLKLTCEPCMKPVPNTLRRNNGAPAVILAGEILETNSGKVWGIISSVSMLDVPPPGTPLDGVVTEIEIDPVTTLWYGKIKARSSVGPM